MVAISGMTGKPSSVIARRAAAFATTLAMLTDCFEVPGGVPVKLLADLMSCLKGGVVVNVVVPAPEYLRFGRIHGVPARFARGARPGIETSEAVEIWSIMPSAALWCHRCSGASGGAGSIRGRRAGRARSCPRTHREHRSCSSLLAR